MKAGTRYCQVRGCRKMARKVVESGRSVAVDTGPMNGSAHVRDWSFELCEEDERRVYQGLVDLVANGVPVPA